MEGGAAAALAGPPGSSEDSGLDPEGTGELWMGSEQRISPGCVGLDNSPQDVHILITGTCEYVTSCGKRDFAENVIK